MSSEEKDKQNQEISLSTQNNELNSKDNDSQVEAKNDKSLKNICRKYLLSF